MSKFIAHIVLRSFFCLVLLPASVSLQDQDPLCHEAGGREGDRGMEAEGGRGGGLDPHLEELLERKQVQLLLLGFVQEQQLLLLFGDVRPGGGGSFRG